MITGAAEITCIGHLLHFLIYCAMLLAFMMGMIIGRLLCLCCIATWYPEKFDLRRFYTWGADLMEDNLHFYTIRGGDSIMDINMTVPALLLSRPFKWIATAFFLAGFGFWVHFEKQMNDVSPSTLLSKEAGIISGLRGISVNHSRVASLSVVLFFLVCEAMLGIGLTIISLVAEHLWLRFECGPEADRNELEDLDI